jgi:hypothetical protein
MHSILREKWKYPNVYADLTTATFVEAVRFIRCIAQPKCSSQNRNVFHASCFGMWCCCNKGAAFFAVRDKFAEIRHPREGGDADRDVALTQEITVLRTLRVWVPAFAGMTASGKPFAREIGSTFVITT